ncbi:hypothetical protein TNCV_436691 [Trichonephila clavipes]|nr:hypothetical protein TNCV_436691 [Trichonephila clavipes]
MAFSVQEKINGTCPECHDYWEQWSRDGAASTRPSSRRPHGTTEREKRRIWCTTVAPRNASAGEIRALVSTTVTQQTAGNRFLHYTSESDFDRKSWVIPDSQIDKVVKTIEEENVEIDLSKTGLEEIQK